MKYDGENYFRENLAYKDFRDIGWIVEREVLLKECWIT